MSFAAFNLAPALLRNLGNSGHERPWAIQTEAIGPMLRQRDVIGLAATGSGKTIAFLVPLIQQLIDEGRPPADPAARLRGLVLCPTRELAAQVAAVADPLLRKTGLIHLCAYGKVGLQPHIAALRRGVDLIIATPGRIRELLDVQAISLARVRYVVIDEADRMLDLGFLPQVTAILDLVSPTRQIGLFTATMPRMVEELARRLLHDPVRIEVGRHTTPVDHVAQFDLRIDQSEKTPLLLHLLQQTSRGRGVLVFCRTRRRVGWVGTALARHGVACGMLHGDRTQAQRLKALERLNRGDHQVIVATDIAARGLHIPAVRFVVNYDLPPNAEEYVHRIGRAGHGGGFGEALTLVAPAEEDRWVQLVRRLRARVEPFIVEGFEVRPVSVLSSASADRSSARRDDRKAITTSGTKAGRDGPVRSRRSRPIGKGQKPGGGVRPLPPNRTGNDDE